MLISVVWVELLTNYVIIIYALVFRYMKSSAFESKPFQERTTEPFQIEEGVPN